MQKKETINNNVVNNNVVIITVNNSNTVLHTVLCSCRQNFSSYFIKRFLEIFIRTMTTRKYLKKEGDDMMMRSSCFCGHSTRLLQTWVGSHTSICNLYVAHWEASGTFGPEVVGCNQTKGFDVWVQLEF